MVTSHETAGVAESEATSPTRRSLTFELPVELCRAAESKLRLELFHLFGETYPQMFLTDFEVETSLTQWFRIPDMRYGLPFQIRVSIIFRSEKWLKVISSDSMGFVFFFDLGFALRDWVEKPCERRNKLIADIARGVYWEARTTFEL